MHRSWSWLAGLAVLVLPLAGVATVLGQEAVGVPRADPVAPSQEVTAIGDIHGDLETFRALLQRAGLTDSEDRWIGGKRHFVQTGDFLDRGAGSRGVMDLLARLEKESSAAGGRATILLGNHEIMNMAGDLVNTTVAEFAAYVDLEDPADRETHRKKILTYLRDGCPLLRSSYTRQFGAVLTESSFNRYFPPGFFGHRAALAPEGKYGRWLLTHDFVYKEGRTLYLHGGLSQRYGLLQRSQINDAVREQLRKLLDAVAKIEALGAFERSLGYRELLYLIQSERRAGGPRPELAPLFAAVLEAHESILFDEEGPLWYRGLAQGNERLLADGLRATLAAQDVDQIVIGHTQPDSLRVEGRFGNRVILIDTGMNQLVYKGCPSAVVVPLKGPVRVIE